MQTNTSSQNTSQNSYTLLRADYEIRKTHILLLLLKIYFMVYESNNGVKKSFSVSLARYMILAYTH